MTDKNEEKIAEMNEELDFALDICQRKQEKTDERMQKLEDDTAQHRSELNSYDVDFRKMLARIEKLEAQVEELSEVEDALNRVNDDLDHALSMANKVEDIIAAWNNRFPDDPIHVPQRRRPATDYLLTDDEWKKRTRIPHPRDWVKKSFDPTTGEWN